MFEDFYDEPSEFDAQIEEFKDGLRRAVKEEYISKIDKLEKELAEMQDLKNNWNEKVEELKKAKREAEKAKNEAMQEAKKLRLSELLDDKLQTAWGICANWEYLHEKCDKCDDDGYIHFKSPQGNEMKEKCRCREAKLIYTPTGAVLVKFVSNNKSKNRCVTSYYKYARHKNNCYDEDEDIFTLSADISDDNPYEQIYVGNAVFLNKEKAQAYCDWLNGRTDKQ